MKSKKILTTDWKRIEFPERAVILFRWCTLPQKEDEPPLKVRINIRYYRYYNNIKLNNVTNNETLSLPETKHPVLLDFMSYTIFL